MTIVRGIFMKRLILVFASMFLLAGCSKSGTWSNSNEQPTSEEPAPAPEQLDNWKMVNEAKFIAAVNAAAEREDPKYPSASMDGFDTSSEFYKITFTRGEDGKYSTTTTMGGYEETLIAVANTRLSGLDYNHLGDGGKAVKPYLYVSDTGKTRVFAKDEDAVIEYSFNEYGYLLNLTGGTDSKDGPKSQYLITWKK